MSLPEATFYIVGASFVLASAPTFYYLRPASTEYLKERKEATHEAIRKLISLRTSTESFFDGYEAIHSAYSQASINAEAYIHFATGLIMVGMAIIGFNLSWDTLVQIFGLGITVLFVTLVAAAIWSAYLNLNTWRGIQEVHRIKPRSFIIQDQSNVQTPQPKEKAETFQQSPDIVKSAPEGDAKNIDGVKKLLPVFSRFAEKWQEFARNKGYMDSLRVTDIRNVAETAAIRLREIDSEFGKMWSSEFRENIRLLIASLARLGEADSDPNTLGPSAYGLVSSLYNGLRIKRVSSFYEEKVLEKANSLRAENLRKSQPKDWIPEGIDSKFVFNNMQWMILEAAQGSAGNATTTMNLAKTTGLDNATVYQECVILRDTGYVVFTDDTHGMAILKITGKGLLALRERDRLTR
jgi:hypothetical protein